MGYVEWHLLEELKKQLDNPLTYQHIAKRYNEMTLRKHGDLPKREAQLEEEITETEAAIAN